MIVAALDYPALREATLPPEQRGVARDRVRMLVTDVKRRHHDDLHFNDLPQVIRSGDLIVVNDSATMPAALRAVRANGERLPVHVGTSIDSSLWIVEPRGAVQPGETLSIGLGATATMLAPVDVQRPRLWYARFELPCAMQPFLAKAGEPLHYAYVREALPLAVYQTMFARVPGSAEMPSAARPFTPAVVRELRRAGATIATITLHCGISSMEKPERPGIERYAVPASTADAVNAARREGRRVIAIGSTVVRALETSRSGDVAIASQGWTDLVVGPSQPPRVVDCVLSGFHMPEATHIDLLRAFVDDELLQQAYAHAARAGYLCHEFGDVHLIVSHTV